MQDKKGAEEMIMECPECGCKIKLCKPEFGDLISCGGCGTALEVRKVDGVLKLVAQEIIGEDWGE